MSHKITILGCGSSGGVPRIGNKWGACDPKNPKNRRSRCSVLIERFQFKGEEQGGKRELAGRTRALIDTSPDLREQLLSAGVGTINGVLYTHDHADHTHGIDDLRVLAYNMKSRVKVYYDAPVKRSLLERFGYCFKKPLGSNYEPILKGHDIAPPEPVLIEGGGGTIELTPIPQVHGDITSLGYRVGSMAYSPDISGLPDSSVERLQGLDLWIVDALRYQHHPSHFSVDDALAWIKRLRPKRAILTHLHIDLDYETLRQSLPAGVEPAYDGMSIEFD